MLKFHGKSLISDANRMVVGTSAVLLAQGSDAWASGDVVTVSASLGAGLLAVRRQSGVTFEVPTACVFASSPPTSARLYFNRHHLNMDEHVGDGFYDPGRGRVASVLPSMAELAKRPAVPGTREVIVVDSRVDSKLRARIAAAREIGQRFTDLRERINALAIYVSDELGGLSAAILSECKAQLDVLMCAGGSPLVKLGDVSKGVCRHRALLFKLLCDELGIGCLLVRGNFRGAEAGDGGGHAWNVVSLYNGERRVVDVMHAPGKIWSEADTVNNYHRLVECGLATARASGRGTRASHARHGQNGTSSPSSSRSSAMRAARSCASARVILERCSADGTRPSTASRSSALTAPVREIKQPR
jgi:hypothetical protein